jgi:lipopolysaccharide transport system ATP-binding protein
VSSSVISIDRLTKEYRISHGQQGTTLRESLMGVFSHREKAREETIRALSDVSLFISRGETVGIIGRNGAGKSTLLKILSKITYPTSGTAKVNGKVAALLEVGTGFHGELTGRENIYMNGSILGMRKKEVDQKLAAIVEFSGVEKFLDTPIKRYSSGMRLRLGFAVAAHLDPDVLIVDEVLAVGDAAFQKKCLNTMEALHASNRTVLFVSHNLAAVENLCRRCIWIDGGEVRLDGESRQVVRAYMESMVGGQAGASDLDGVLNRRGDGKIRFRAVEFLTPDGYSQSLIRAGDPLVIRFHYSASEPVADPSFGFRMYTDTGTLVTETSTWHHAIPAPVSKAGSGYLDLEIGCLNLMPARYTLSLWATDMQGAAIYDNVEHAVALEVETANIYQSGRNLDSRSGIVFFPQRWNLSGTLQRTIQSRDTLAV